MCLTVYSFVNGNAYCLYCGLLEKCSNFLCLLPTSFSKFYGKEVGVISWLLLHLKWKNIMFNTGILTPKVELWISFCQLHFSLQKLTISAENVYVGTCYICCKCKEYTSNVEIFSSLLNHLPIIDRLPNFFGSFGRYYENKCLLSSQLTSFWGSCNA